MSASGRTRLGEIADDTVCRPAHRRDRPDCPIERGLIDVAADDRRAFLGQPQRNGVADPFSGPR